MNLKLPGSGPRLGMTRTRRTNFKLARNDLVRVARRRGARCWGAGQTCTVTVTVPARGRRCPTQRLMLRQLGGLGLTRRRGVTLDGPRDSETEEAAARREGAAGRDWAGRVDAGRVGGDYDHGGPVPGTA